MKQITLYVTKTCGYCRAAEDLLLEKGIPYTKYDITEDDQKRSELINQTHQRTVPLIFEGDTFIGGYQELSSKIKFESMKNS